MTKRETCQLCTRRRVNEALAPLTDAEAGAIQAVSEVETLRRELAGHRELWAHVCFRLGVPDGTDKQDALDAAIDALTPTTRVFTEAEVREALRRVRAMDGGPGKAMHDALTVDEVAAQLGLTLD